MMNFTILRFESLGSTNDEAARQARLGAAEGVGVVAREQTAGRGRRERVWHSPANAGLYFSLILRPQIERQSWALITLAAAVAVHDALLQSCELKTDIKWANDVHSVAGKKLCGILAENLNGEEHSPGENAVILGIGINLKQEAVPPELDEIATSIESETGQLPEYERVLAALTANLRQYYEMLHETGGAQKIVDNWSARSSYTTGKKVKVALENEILQGVTCGLELSGALRLKTDKGIIKTIYAGDVTALREQK